MQRTEKYLFCYRQKLKPEDEAVYACAWFLVLAVLCSASLPPGDELWKTMRPCHRDPSGSILIPT